MSAFRKAFAEVARLMHGTSTDRAALARGMRLCTTPGASMLPALREWMLQAIVYYTLGSYPFPSTYMTLGVKPLPPYPMRPVCAALTAQPAPSMSGLADALAVFYNLTGEARCRRLNSGACALPPRR